MSDKLYLIRVDMERFIGPVTLREVRESYRRMEFGLQDEIASSNKPWVAFDDLERIGRIYPELVNLIKKEMLSGWGSTEPEPKSLNRFEKSDLLPSRTLANTVKFIGVLVLICTIGSLGFLYKERKLHYIKLLVQDPTFLQALIYYSDGYDAQFEAFIDQNRSHINRSLKRRTTYRAWIPYVRAVAFENEGTWPGLSFRRLRGKDAEHTPLDCSLSAWLMRWKKSRSSWSVFLQGKQLPEQDWAKILIWDPHWIGQRLNHPLWIQPRNFYEACYKMSLKALEKIDPDGSDPEAEVLKSRLKWIHIQMNDEFSSQTEEYHMSGSLWTLSCIESSVDNVSLNQCKDSMKLNGSWKKLIAERTALRAARIILLNNSSLRAKKLNDLRESIKTLPNEGFISRFDYSDELKFYQILLQNSGNIERAESKMKDYAPSLRFVK